MQQHDGPTNGFPSWPQLVGMFASIENRLGGVQMGQHLSIEQSRKMDQRLAEGLTRVHERIDELKLHGSQEITDLQGRVTTLEATKGVRRQRDWLGLSTRELLSLIALIVMSITGTLSSDVIAAWLR